MRRMLVALLGVGTLAAGPAPGSAQPAPGPSVPADRSEHPVITWMELTTLAKGGRAADVSFANSGLNIVNPIEMAWVLDAQSRQMIAVASKPITGTADAGEEMGRRGAGMLHAPAALCVGSEGHFVLESDGRLVIVRSGWVDSLELGPGSGPERDIAVGTGGLVYVLLGREVRVYADPPGPAPVLVLRLSPELLPASALAVSARGDLYVAGRGKLALAVYELGPQGSFRMVRSRTARELGARQPAGVAVPAALLLPLDLREGWVGQDRFVVLSDSGRRGLLALEAATLAPLDWYDLAPEAPDVVPGRIDVSNRGQIAVADPVSGAAYSLPARILARMIEKAKIRWRQLEADSTSAAGGSGP